MVHKDILWRYFNQTATPEEQQQAIEWLTDPARREEVLQFIQKAWEEENAGTAPAMPFEKILEEAIRRETAANVIPMHRRKWYWVAASVIVLAVLATGILIGYYAIRPGNGNTGEWVLAEAQTGRGQTAQLLLSDGSHVVLNADSRITFPKSSDVKQVVYLEGEALFNIRNQEEPVIIRTKELVTTASGSQVKISAFPKDSTVTIAVEKGTAKVSSETKTFPLLKLRIPARDSAARQPADTPLPKVLPLIKLRPAVVVKENEVVTINKNNGVASLNTQGNEPVVAARTAVQLVFQQAGPAEIVQTLEQRFGVSVILNSQENSLPPYNAEFRSATLEEVLQHLCEQLQLDYIINDNHVFLIKRKKSNNK